MGEAIQSFVEMTGFSMIANDPKVLIMIAISLVLMYLAIVKKFEPLLLLPIAFGMLLTNLPGAEMYHRELFASGHVDWAALSDQGGLIDYLYLGIKLGIYPCLIFMGVGAGTDFGPLIANPKTLFMGAAAQLGIFIAFMGAIGLTALFPNAFNFGVREASSIGIIGGADGPTAIYLTTKLAPQLLGPIAVAAYSYMALVPVIQPPIMKALTTKKERQISMEQLRPVSKTEKIIFPIVVTIFVSLLVPSAAPLDGMQMCGNLHMEGGVPERLTGRMLNPLNGSAGVSAVPMAARVSQVVGQKEKPGNYLLMHAMGPNVAGVIGSAIAAGVLLSLYWVH